MSAPIPRIPPTAALVFLAGALSFAANSATVASQDFGTSPVGTPVTLSISVPGAASPSLSLRYSIDYSLGACTPNGSGCSLPVTFNPTKPGLRQDAVIVQNGAGQITEEIFLHGVGLGGLPVFSPALATFRALIPGESVPFGVTGIAAEPNGEILVLVQSVIDEFDPATGNLTAVPGLPAGSNAFPGLYVLATDAAGNIFYVNENSGLHRLDRVTGTDSLFAGNVFASSIAIDPAGAIFYDQGDQVFKIDPNTNAVTVVAGNGTHGYAGDGGPAVNAELASPDGIAVDISGNLYIADSGNDRVRKIDGTGTISTIAGTGHSGNTGDAGPAVNAEISPSVLAVDAAGDLYVGSASAVRRIDSGTGLIWTIAGATPQNDGSSTESNPFFAVGASGPAQDLGLYSAGIITLDADSDLWIGMGVYPSGDGLYEISSAAYPISFPFTAVGQSAASQTVSLLNAGTDNLNQLVVGASGQNAADFGVSSSCAGQLVTGSACTISVTFTADSHTAPVATITVADSALSSPQTISVSGASGGQLPATQIIPAVAVGSSSTPQSFSIQFSGSVSGVSAALASGTEFSLGQTSCSGTGTVSCSVQLTFTPLYPGLRHDAIRFLDSTGAVVYECFLSGVGSAPQWLADPGTVGSIPMPPVQVTLSAIDTAGNLYAVQANGWPAVGFVYRFNPNTSQWTIVAGQTASVGVDTGDGGPATAATLTYVNAVALDPAGNMFIVENYKVRRVDAQTGIITTIAQEGGTAIAIDQQGYLYLLNLTRTVRKLNPSTGVAIDYAGNGQAGSTGDGGLATSASLDQPVALAFDNAGNLLIGQYVAVRKVDASSGIITTYAHTCTPASIAVDAAGDLYLDCGELEIVPAGSGTPGFVETQVINNIVGRILRDPAGNIYTSNGVTLSPALQSPFSISGYLNAPPTTHPLELTNTGNTALAINSITLANADPAVLSQSNTCGQSVAPGQTCTVSLNFAPAESGTVTANLTVSSVLGNLQSTVYASSNPLLQASPSSLNFGNVYLPYGSLSAITLTSSNATAVTISSVSSSGANASDFIVASNCPATLPIGQSCTLFVVFEPSAPGLRTANATIYEGTGALPQIVPITGTGVVASAAQAAGALHQISVGADGALWGLNSSGAIYRYNPQGRGWVQAPGALAHISVGAGAFVWGLNSAGQIYRWNTTLSSWDSIPGNLAQIAVGADGEVWGINAQSSIYRYNSASQTWQQIPGTLQQIAVGFDGAVWGTNSAHSVYHYNPGAGFFEQVPGALTSIAVGADGDVWGIGNNQSVYHFEAHAGSFQQMAGSLAQIAVGGAGNVWGLGSSGQIYEYNAANASWSSVPGTLATIAAAMNGAVWGLNSADSIYEFTGTVQPLNALQPVPGALNQISVGIDNTAWGLDAAGDIFTFDPASQSWIAVPGQLARIAVGSFNNVWGLNSAGQIYRYNAAHQGWDWIPGALTQIAVGANGAVWGLNSTQQIYQFNAATQAWTWIPGALKQIAVGADGAVWGINNSGQIYAFNAATESWTYVPGTLKQIAVGSSTNVWGINEAGGVYRFNAGNDSWDNIPGVSLAQIAVAFDGAVWGTTATNQVFQFNNQDGIWTSIPGSLSAVSVGSDFAVWGVSPAGVYLYR